MQPYITETISDPALGLVAGDAKKTFALVGPAAGGVPGQVYSFTNLQAVASTLLRGALAEQCAQVLQACGGSATVLATVPTLTAGSLVVGTKTGSGLATIVNNASAPTDDIDVVVKVLTAGAVGAATVAVSLDGGRTYGSEVATAANFTVPNTGVALTMSSTLGNFAAGDTYAFEAKGPSYTVNNLNTAIDALLADGRDFSLLHVVGIPADTATAASLAAAVQTKLETAAANHRPARGFIEAPEGVTDSALKTAVAAITNSPRVLLWATFEPLNSILNPGRTEQRPAAWAPFARACKAPISVALHATSPLESGPLDRVGPLKSRPSDPVAYSYHDETTAAVSLDDGRIATLRTWPGQSGIFVNRARTLAALSSDYTELANGRVIDEAQRVGYRYMFNQIGRRFTVDRTTGQLAEREIKALEEGGRQALVRALVNEGHATDVEFVIVRGDNLITSKLIRYRVRVLPVGYPDFISGEYGMKNPALELAPAA